MINFTDIPTAKETPSTVQLDLTKNTERTGVKLDLTKNDGTSLRTLYFGASWDPVRTGANIDVDTTAVALHSDNKWHSVDDVLYFNNRKTSFMEHSEDARTGDEVSGDGDDEYLKIYLDKVPHDVNEIVLIATIYDAIKRKQTFGMVRNMIHILDNDSGEVIANINLSEDYRTDSAVILGVVTRENGTWKFVPSGQGALVEIGDVLNQYAG